MNNLNQRILDVLRASKKINPSELESLQAQCAQEGKGKLKEILIRRGLVSEKELVSILSAELKIPFLNLSKYKLSPELAKILSAELARRHKVVPVSRIGDTLTLAMPDPSNIFVIDDIALLTHCRVECVISTQKDIAEALDRLYGSPQESMHAIAKEMDFETEDIGK